MFDLYKYISQTEIQEAKSPLYTTIEVPEIQKVITQETITEEVDGEQVERVVDVITENTVNRTVEVVITNPKESDFIKAGYKTLQEGTIPTEEPTETQYIKTTYEDGEKITVNKEIEDKEVVQEEKPTEPLDDYHFYEAYTYHTETKIINSWRVIEKEIEDVTVINEETQYRGENFTDVFEETKVKRTYEVIDKEVIEDVDIPPEDYKAEWYTKEEYTHYAAKEIHHGYTYTATEERRIAYLTSTKRDFCLAIKELKGITYTQLMQLVESSEDFLMEWRECTILYRFNPALDTAGQALGLTHEYISNVFKYVNDEMNLEELKGV